MRSFSWEDRDKPPTEPRTGVAGPPWKALDVIVCDDERHIVRLIQVNLMRKGYTVRTAFDGRECLDLVANQLPDVLILDQVMPYMSGDEVISILRSDPATAGIRIILLTPPSQHSHGDPPFPSGPTAVMSKPFNPIELMRRIA